MKAILITSLIAATFLAPVTAYAQRGHGGGGGGGYHGGAMGHAVGHPSVGHPGGAPMGHGPVGGGHFAGRPDYHGGWYHGNWGGGGWGYRPWGWGGYGGWGGWGPGFGWGFGLGAATVGIGMGLGSPWGWGYYNYYNPYWAGPVGGATYINYSQPVYYQPPQQPAQQQYAPAYGSQYGANSPPPAAQSPSQTEALAIFENARGLFMQNQYKAALTQTDRAIALLPNDSVMHEFRALCLFAMKDYQQAAAAVYAVTSTGPGWDWTTVSNLYPDINVYTGQLRSLETYCEANTRASAPRFLLAYHYVLAGHKEQAAELLTEVIRLEPKDQLSAQLLKGLTTPGGEQPAPADTRPAAPPGKPVDEASIVGAWKASRPDGSNVELNLSGDKKFSWKFGQTGKQQQMSGTYTLANNFLILSASDQNSLVGQVSMQPGDKLAFKLAGGNPADPGLTFVR